MRLEKILLKMGFKSVQIEMPEIDDKDNLEQLIWCKVWFNWRWNKSDKIHQDGRQEFEGKTEDEIYNKIMKTIQDKNNYEILVDII